MHIKALRTKNVLYAVVDPALVSCRHPLLFKKVFDLTFVLTQRLSTVVNGYVMYFATIDEAMRFGRPWDLVIVQSVGNFIIEYEFLEALDEFFRSNKDFFLLAFPPIRQNPEDGGALEFDTRMMVVNVRTWQKLGHPGLDEEQALPEDAPTNGRANRAIHGSPPSLPTGASREVMPAVPSGRGRRFLDAVMSRGLPLHNVPHAIRSCSLYIWPEFESGRLYEGMVNRDESLVSNPDQKRWIRLSIPRSTIWIYNSEPYRFNVAVRQCDAYFGPAAGFKYLDILSYEPNAEFLFYDENEESLEWIRALKCNWDGNDFPGYVNDQPEWLRKKFKYGNSSIEQNQKRLIDDFAGEEGFKRLWNLFRSAKARFFKCDLFNSCDVRELASKTEAMRPFFYYSNIFSTKFTLTVFSREEAEERYMRFKEIVKTRFPGAVMHGADVAGRWH